MSLPPVHGSPPVLMRKRSSKNSRNTSPRLAPNIGERGSLSRPGTRPNSTPSSPELRGIRTGGRTTTSSKEAIFQDAFNKIDKNKTGSIEASEMHEVLKELGWEHDAAAVRQALDFLDKDHDGTVDSEEFLRWSQYAWKSRVLDGSGMALLGPRAAGDKGAKDLQRSFIGMNLNRGSLSDAVANVRRRSMKGSISEGRTSLLLDPSRHGSRHGSRRGSRQGSRRVSPRASPRLSPFPAFSSPVTGRKISAHKEDIFRAAFDHCDEDGSGTIDASELPKVLKYLEWEHDDFAVKQALDFLDKDHDGEVDFEEFLRWSQYAWKSRVLQGGDEARSLGGLRNRGSLADGIADVRRRSLQAFDENGMKPLSLHDSGMWTGALGSPKKDDDDFDGSVSAPVSMRFGRGFRKTTPVTPPQGSSRRSSFVGSRRSSLVAQSRSRRNSTCNDNAETGSISKLHSPENRGSTSGESKQEKKTRIMKEAFACIDKDGSGQIEATEMAQLLQELGWEHDDFAVQQALNYLDKDLDGQVSFDEFTKWTEYAWRSRVLQSGRRLSLHEDMAAVRRNSLSTCKEKPISNERN